MQQLTLALNHADLYIRRSFRARRLRVSVTPVGKIEVVVPHNVSAKIVEHFLQAQDNWITSKSRQIAAVRSRELNEAKPDHIKLAAVHEKWKIVYHAGRRPNLRIEEDGVTHARLLHLSYEHDHHISELLKKWLTTKAKSILFPWLEQVSQEIGLSYSAVSIRGQKTRWASCSAQGNISLNRCMLFLKPDQVRYLLVHELCHTREMNHSVKFWKLVGQYVPDYKEQEKLVNACCYQLPRWAY